MIMLFINIHILDVYYYYYAISVFLVVDNSVEL